MDLINRNKVFVTRISRDEKLKARRDELIKGQHPTTLVITCSDSRVVPEYIFSATLGELFVIRTAGNVVNEGELATIEYAVEHLHIKDIVVLGHTHCGAIHAAINHETGKYLDPIISRITKNIGVILNEEEASEINASREVEYIKSKFIDKKLNIKAYVYNIETSLVKEII